MITDKSRLWNAAERGNGAAQPAQVRKYWLKAQLRTLLAFIGGFLCALGMFLLYADGAQPKDYSTTMAATSFDSLDYTLDQAALAATSPAAYLLQNVRVLCLVLTHPSNHDARARHVRATWGGRCSKVIFASSAADDELGAVQVIDAEYDTYDDLWNKTRAGFKYVADNFLDDYDWFLKADDDTYVIMENLRLMLWPYTADMPVYFGYKMRRYEVSYMSGGTSYVLSREALRRFIADSADNDTICPPARKYGVEDFHMGICLQNVGVRLIDAKYALANDVKGKLFPLDIRRYFTWNETNSIPEWLREMTTSKIETGLPDCCSNYSIAFHYMSPENMYVFEFLIYWLRAFGVRQPVDAVLPTRMSMSQVLQLFPAETNDDIRNLKAMLNKPANFK